MAHLSHSRHICDVIRALFLKITKNLGFCQDFNFSGSQEKKQKILNSTFLSNSLKLSFFEKLQLLKINVRERFHFHFDVIMVMCRHTHPNILSLNRAARWQRVDLLWKILSMGFEPELFRQCCQYWQVATDAIHIFIHSSAFDKSKAVRRNPIVDFNATRIS